MPDVESPEVLMDDNGLRITTAQVITPVGDFPLEEIRGADARTTRPLWGPLLLALLGTINLLVAFQSRFWLDFAAAGLMLGLGVVWRVGGTRYVLSLELPTGRRDVWLGRHEATVLEALRIVRQSLVRQPPSSG